MNKYFFTILIALFAVVSQAQNIRTQSGSRGQSPLLSKGIRDDLGSTSTRKSQKTKKHAATTSRREKENQIQHQPDTVYALLAAKQHGWFVPLGIITKEQTQHRNSSVMFTGKNKCGHWTKVETINAYGGHSLRLVMPYILRNGDQDEAADSEWIERLQKNCIIEMIADPLGENVIQERLYDDDGHLLFVYSRTPIGEDEHGNQIFIGSYKDMYGLPAEMRKTEQYTYGTIVRITEDKWGNDHIIEYLDAKGVNKLNADSVYRSVHIVDQYGRELRFGSQNKDGEYVIDNWGNSGVIHTWNSDHTVASAMYTDAEWNPMPMPSKKSQETCGVIKVLYKYDDYKREVERIFVDADDQPMENVYGCHRIEYVFDDKGNIIKQIGYDRHGNVSPLDESQTAICELQYDSLGRLIEALFLDKNGRPNNADGYLSKKVIQYDEQGKTILLEQYVATLGEEELNYKEEYKPNYTYILWPDGTSRIDSLDAKGRKTFVGFYNAEGKSEMYEGRAYERYTYVEKGKISLQTQVNYDQEGRIADASGFAKEVRLTDSLQWKQTIWRYDRNNELVETYLHCYSPNFKTLLSQDDTNRFGTLARCGGSSSVRYYKGQVMYNHKGARISHLCGVDEFGEPDYIVSSSGIYYYSKSGTWYDEDNKEITSKRNLKDELPKVMTIEVIDSCAYQLGLKDNDVILEYGDYAVDLDSVVSELSFRQQWMIRSVLDASKEKRMVVFRVTDASKNEYGLYEIRGLKGTCSELGFIPHTRYLTNKQLQRMKAAVEMESNRPHPILTHSDLKKMHHMGGSNLVLLSYDELYRSERRGPYATEVTDPAFLLASSIKDLNLKWTIEDGNDVEPFEQMLESRRKDAFQYPCQDFFFTRDGKSLRHISITDQRLYTHWFDAYISDKDFQQLSALYRAALDSTNIIMKHVDKKTYKTLVGNWRSQKNDSLSYQPESFLSLSKDGTCHGWSVNYGMRDFFEGLALFKLSKKFKGTWRGSGDWLFIYPVAEDTTLTCVGLQSDDEELKQRAIRYLNVLCKSDPNVMSHSISFDSLQIGNDFCALSVSKNNFDAKLMSGKSISYQRIRGEAVLEPDSFAISDEEMASIDEQIMRQKSGYVGCWQTHLQDPGNMNVQMCLFPNGEVNLDMDGVIVQPLDNSASISISVEISINGTWKTTGTGFIMDADTSQVDIVLDFKIQGMSEDAIEQISPALQDYLNSAKQEFAQELRALFFKSDMNIEKVDSMKILIEGMEFAKLPSEIEVVIGFVEGENGYLVEHGYKGPFAILEWCDWDCRDGIDEFETELEKQRENRKHVLLLPVESKDGHDDFKGVVELDVPEKTLLGMRIQTITLGYPYYKKNVLRRFNAYKFKR